MSFKSLIPIGGAWSHRDINSFNSLRQEVNRLFEDFSKGFAHAAGLIRRDK